MNNDDQKFDASQTADSPAAQSSSDFSWTASEYIDHNQGAGWYAGLIVATAALAVGFYFLTHDYFGSGFVVAMAVIVGAFAARKPQQVTYEISADGFKFGDKFYKYTDFKSFAIIDDGGLSSVNFLPVKRFMPPISAYFDPADEDKIVAAVGDNLPEEQAKLDAVDKLSRRLRF